MRNLLILFSALILFSSCEKEIDLDLNSSNPQIVIEGNITDQPGPYQVKITRSVNYDEPNTFPPITGAVVTISDNMGNSELLSEVENGIYETFDLVGTPGTTYYLTVNAEGKDYAASSTMPEKVNLDTLQFEPFSGPDGDYSILPVYKDPETPGNHYRFFLTVNSEEDEAYIVFNDNINNGLVNTRSLFSPDYPIVESDTVSVEMRCIDLSTYNYFYTLSQFSGGGPIGGTTPTNPPNNITGNPALGFFAAYTVQVLTETAPPTDN